MLTTPALIADTSPVDVTVAMDGLLLDHVPPTGVALMEVVDPTHNELLPVITADPMTVTVVNALQPPDV